MTSKWEFLKPWYVALQGSLTTKGASDVRISFRCNTRYDRSQRLYVTIPINAETRRNVVWRRHLREAMELFTALSFVNNRVFAEFFPPTRVRSGYYYPEWWLYPVGILASKDPAENQSPVSWGALLGFPDGSASLSPDYRAAMERLETLGLETTSKKNIENGFTIGWTCGFPDSYVIGRQDFEISYDTLSSFVTGFREMFSASAPPLVQLRVLGSEAKLMGMQRLPYTPCAFLRATISNLDTSTCFMELAVALAWTTASMFSLTFEDLTIDTPQVTTNVGLFLNRLISGFSLSVVSRDYDEVPLVPSRVEYSKLKLRCFSVPDTVFTATCSAVAEFSCDAHLSDFNMSEVSADGWSWLTYAICCGALSDQIQTVGISRGRLTKPDLLAIKAVLRTNYPRPVLATAPATSVQYGFVHISAGTELQLCRLANNNNTIIVVAGESLCRALYNPADEDNCAELIVPGYGVCKTKLGGDIQFTPDSGGSVLQRKRVSGSSWCHPITSHCVAGQSRQ